MKKAVAKAVKKAGDRFYGYKTAVLTFKDPEDLHQMRVSGRTLLSYMYALADRKESERPGFKKVRKPLKTAMGSLGALRDADVLLDEVEGLLASFSPDQRSVIEKWLACKRDEREAFRVQLAETLPDTIDKKWEQRMKLWARDSVPSLVDKKSISIKVEALREERDRSFEAIRNYPDVDMTDENFLMLLHNARIRVKKLRYTLTVLKKFLEVDSDEIESLKNLQDRLGHIHDISVWIAQLKNFDGDEEALKSIEARWHNEMLETLLATGIM